MFTAYFVAYFVVRLSSLQAKRCGSSFFCFFSRAHMGRESRNTYQNLVLFSISLIFVLEITLQVFLAVL